jgi:type IV pilus assembly protein PilC
MPKFTYKAVRKEDGSKYENTVEAKDRFEVYGLVRKEGGEIISVREEGGIHSIDLHGNILAPFQRVREMDRILFTRNLGNMLNAGLSLSRSLSVIKRQSKQSKLAEIIQGIDTEIQTGGSLSSGMLKYPNVFPNLVTSMIQAGEESGTLAETLLTISKQLDKAYELKKKIRGAMIYPSIIMSVLVGVGALMMIYIVPSLTETFRDMDVELPVSTQIIVSMSDFMVAHTLLALLLMVGSVVSGVVALRTTNGRRAVETLLLHVPVIGSLIKESNSAHTGRTLSSLLSAGVNMMTAIDITQNVLQNSYYKEVLGKAREQVQKGQPLAKVFLDAEKLYPPLVGELIAVGEETGALPEMLQEVGKYYEREVGRKTKNMSTIIEPALMLVVGGAVGFFAISMISPIYSITSGIM